MESVEKPIKGCDIEIDGYTGTCDYAWKQGKVLLFCSDHEEEYIHAKNSDWKCFYANEEGLSAELILQSLKEY